MIRAQPFIILTFSNSAFIIISLTFLINDTINGGIVSIHLHVKNALTLGKSLIYIINNKGHSIEPCGTPVVITSLTDCALFSQSVIP